MDIPILARAWLIPCYPIIGAIFTAPWLFNLAGQLGTRPAGYINILMAGIAFIHAILTLITGWDSPSHQITYSWLHTNTLDINFPIEISTITLTAITVVTGINLICSTKLSQTYSSPTIQSGRIPKGLLPASSKGVGSLLGGTHAEETSARFHPLLVHRREFRSSRAY